MGRECDAGSFLSSRYLLNVENGRDIIAKLARCVNACATLILPLIQDRANLRGGARLAGSDHDLQPPMTSSFFAQSRSIVCFFFPLVSCGFSLVRESAISSGWKKRATESCVMSARGPFASAALRDRLATAGARSGAGTGTRHLHAVGFVWWIA